MKRERLRRLALALFLLLAAVSGRPVRGQSPSPAIELVTSTLSGAAGGGQQFIDVIPYDRGPSHLSADSRLVVFASASSALVAGDSNGLQDVFVRDRATGITMLVSRSLSGGPGDGHSGTPVISANGRFVAFVSAATNLVAGDSNGSPDVFLRDLETGVTSIVSVSSTGVAADAGAVSPSISADGRFVAFVSTAASLVADDTNLRNSDIFVHDRVTGATERVSLRADGSQLVRASAISPSISADGRRVAFAVFDDPSNGPPPASAGSNLHHGVYVRDLDAATTVLVSATPAGTPSEFHYSTDPAISADGRFVSFSSFDDLDPAAPDTAVEFDGPFSDIFVRDLATSTTERVSMPFPGGPAEESGVLATISGDGRYVAYVTPDSSSVRIRDRAAHRTTVIEAPGGAAPDGGFDSPSIGRDGQVVYFESSSTNLVAGDTNGVVDGFVFLMAPAADLSLSLNASSLRPAADSDVTLTLTVANAGPGAASSVAARAVLPPGLSFVSATGAGGYSSATGMWTVGGLISGATASIQIVAHFSAAVAVPVFAEISSASPGDPDSTPGNGAAGEDDEQTLTLTPPLADLSLTLSANTDAPGVNTNVVLTTALVNAGPAAATGVAVRVTLPAAVTFVSASPSGGYTPSSGIWSVPAIPGGATITLQLVGRVTSTSPFDVIAQVSAANEADPDSVPNNSNPAEDDQGARHFTPSASLGIVVNDASMTVNRTDGRCTLVEAIVAANTDLPSGDLAGECAGGSGADTIFLRAATPPYVLSTVNNRSDGPNGLPVISSDITIEADGELIARSTAPGTPDFRIFDVAPLLGRLTLNHAHLANGRLAVDVPGTLDSSGAGILTQGVLTLSDTEVSNNLAACLGGGVAAFGPTVLRNAVVRGNSAGCSGGGMYAFEAGTVTVQDSSFALNAAPAGSGGGLMIHGTIAAAITRTVFDSNTAKFDGGAILAHNTDANLTMIDSVVTNNLVSAGHGGGIANGRLGALGLPIVFGGTMTLTNVTVRNNTASGGYGGGIANAGILTAAAGTIAGNQVASVGCGGGIHNARQATVTGTEISGNRSTSGGGGICSLNAGTLSVTDATVTGNTTSGPGGGVALFASSARIVGSRLIGNRAAASGGGLSSLNSGSGLSVELDTTIVRGNDAGTAGGGVAISAGSVAIRRSTIALNTARFGGGIDVTGDTAAADIANTTISGNIGSTGSGAVNIASAGPSARARSTIAATTIVDNTGDPGGVFNGGVLALTGSILIGNHRVDGVFAECAKDAAVATSSVARNLLGQDGACFLVSEDVPARESRFVNPSLAFSSVVAPLADNGGATPTHALVAGSLAIDAGADDAACAPADQRGLARPADGDGDGVARCDLGAVEQQVALPGPQASIGSLVPSVAVAGSGVTVVTVFGSGFTAGTVAFFNGSPRATFVFGPSQLRVTLLAVDLAPAGDIGTGPVSVQTPGTLESNRLLFTIVSARVAAIDSHIALPGTAVAASVAPTSAGQSGVAATLTNNGSGTGAAILSVANYSTSPIAGTAFAAGGFFDIQVTGADSSDALAARFYYPTGLSIVGELSLQLQYWTGTAWAAVAGSGGAAPDKNTTDNLDGTVSGGRFSVTLDGTSVPRITDLSGTVFALLAVEQDTTPPSTTATPSPQANVNGWNSAAVTVALTASDDRSGVAATEVNLDGRGWSDYLAPIQIDRDGVHTVRYRSRDVAGNLEAVRTLIVRIDTHAPLLLVQAIPAVVKHADGKLVDVDVWSLLFDLVSGGDGFKLVSVVSSDPKASPDDIRGWMIGTPDTHGQLRGGRSGGGPRVYTLTYEGRDRAGNSVRAITSVRIGS